MFLSATWSHSVVCHSSCMLAIWYYDIYGLLFLDTVGGEHYWYLFLEKKLPSLANWACLFASEEIEALKTVYISVYSLHQRCAGSWHVVLCMDGKSLLSAKHIEKSPMVKKLGKNLTPSSAASLHNHPDCSADIKCSWANSAVVLSARQTSVVVIPQ